MSDAAQIEISKTCKKLTKRDSQLGGSASLTKDKAGAKGEISH